MGSSNGRDTFLLKRTHRMELNSVLNPVVDTWRPGHPNFMPFSVGQKVLLKTQTKGFLSTNKFLPNFQGPFEVVVAHRNGLTYEIKDSRNDQIVRAHYSKLRLFKYPPDYIIEHPQYKTKENVTLVDLNNENVVFPGVDGLFISSSCSDSSQDSSSDSSSGFSGFISNAPRKANKCVMNNEKSRHNLNFTSTGDSCTDCLLERSKMSNDCMATTEDITECLAALRSSLGWSEDAELLDPCIESVEVRDLNEFSLLDWSFSSSGTFELPSIDSTDMIDVSREFESHSLVLHLSSPKDISSESSDFGGFDAKERTDELYQRSAKIKELLEKNSYAFIKNTSSVESFNERNLRSKGPIKDLPWVQNKTIERVRSTKSSKYDSA